MIRFQKKSRTSKNTNVQIIISLSVTPPSMFRQVSTTESTKCRKALRKRTRRIERTTWSNLQASQEFHKILDMSHHAISHFVHRFRVQIYPSHLVTLKIRIMRNCDAEPPPSARGREAVTDAMVLFLQTIAPDPLHNCNILELVFHIPKPLSGQSVQCSSPVANAFLFSPAYFKSSQTYGELDPSWNHYLGIRFNPHCILIFWTWESDCLEGWNRPDPKKHVPHASVARVHPSSSIQHLSISGQDPPKHQKKRETKDQTDRGVRYNLAVLPAPREAQAGRPGFNSRRRPRQTAGQPLQTLQLRVSATSRALSGSNRQRSLKSENQPNPFMDASVSNS